MANDMTTQTVVVLVILGLGFIGSLLLLGTSQGKLYMQETLLILIEITLLAIYMDMQKFKNKIGGKK